MPKQQPSVSVVEPMERRLLFTAAALGAWTRVLPSRHEHALHGPLRHGRHTLPAGPTTIQIVAPAVTELTDRQKEDAMLAMVNSYRGALPAELVLAVIFQEGGQGAFYVNGYLKNSFYRQVDAPWAQPSNNTDGIMQVTAASGYHERSGAYTNDQPGYDHAIHDGSDFLLNQYAHYGTFWETVLHYNSGGRTLYTYKGRNAGDRQYLSHVAGHVRNDVPPMFAITNTWLADKLDAAQQVVNGYLNDPNILAGQPIDYYTPFQAQLDADLHSLIDPPGLTATPGSAWAMSGPANNKLLTVSAGTVTLTTDLSTVYGTISLTVLNGATCVFAGDQHFKDVALSGSGGISVGTPG
jgi:hypothetical protein